jgi:hypothetical protein
VTFKTATNTKQILWVEILTKWTKASFGLWSPIRNVKCHLTPDKNLKVRVEYAADLPVSKYGSGFPVTSQANWKDSDFEYETNFYNLNNAYKSSLSMLKVIDIRGEKISGVTSPWVYMGMKFASFCWHVEDLYINSLNYNHKGATKTWYIVPAKYKEDFDKFVKRKYPKQLESKPDFLHRITLMIDPLELIANGIKVYLSESLSCRLFTWLQCWLGC